MQATLKKEYWGVVCVRKYLPRQKGQQRSWTDKKEGNSAQKTPSKQQRRLYVLEVINGATMFTKQIHNMK